jgi:hypothetical protein
MSTSYYVYAEVRVGKKWYNLNPLMKKPDGSSSLRPIYVGCSSFFEIYNYMEQHRTSVGIPNDMSPELRAVFHKDLDETCDGWGSKTTWREIYERELFIVPFSKGVAPRVKRDRPHMFQGYVDRRSITMFEAEEIEEINCWLDGDEYAVLTEKEKRRYRFYEWDEPYSEYEVFRIIYERINAMLYWFDFADAFENRREYWDNEPSISDVRVIVERS